MSGFSYPLPTFVPSCYNPAFYLSLDQTGYLTDAYAQTLYLGIKDYRLSYITGIIPGTATPGVVLAVAADGSLAAPPAYVMSITPGIASLSKALVLDGNSNISGINSLSAASLTGTIQTTAQPNITSEGTQTGLRVSGNINDTLSTAAQPNIASVGTLTGLSVSGNICGTLSTSSQPNITSVGTLTSLSLAGSISGATTISASGIVSLTNTTFSSSSVSGALVVSGGIGIAKNITLGGTGD
ncbi:hypothetical protein ON010_g18731 [Phytophthora cinnamomi]|nr:hypothetical protein ON010_g18731 [Phytophthora cinnamomi]